MHRSLLIQTPGWTIPSCQVHTYLFSSAHGQWCWGGQWGLPPGCSGRCSHHPRPGRSSTHWPPLQTERGHDGKVIRTRKSLRSSPTCTHTGHGTHATPHAHTHMPMGDTPHVSAPFSASPGTFLQLFHHLDLEVAHAAVCFLVARSPGLAANAVPYALAHSLETLGRDTRWVGQEAAQGKQGKTSPLKGKGGGATPCPHPASRARSKRRITESNQLTKPAPKNPIPTAGIGAVPRSSPRVLGHLPKIQPSWFYPLPPWD